MKEEKKALLNAHIKADKSGLIFPNLEKYKTRDADADLNLSFKRATDEAMAMRKALMKKFWFLFTPVMIISVILLLVGALLLDEAQNTVAIILIVCSTVSFVIFTLAAMKHLHKANTSEEYTDKLNKVFAIRDSIELSLGAPGDINKIDIIYPASRQKKNGNIGIFQTLKIFEFKIFKKDGDVCVIANNSLYTLAGCEIKSFKINPKQVSFNEWNKRDGYSSPKYKEYKIGYYSKSNTYFIKNTGELCLSVGGDDFYITVFPWSVPDLEQALEITATTL